MGSILKRVGREGFPRRQYLITAISDTQTVTPQDDDTTITAGPDGYSSVDASNRETRFTK